MICQAFFGPPNPPRYTLSYNPFVVSLSKHRRNPLKILTLRQAQGERDVESYLMGRYTRLS